MRETKETALTHAKMWESRDWCYISLNDFRHAKEVKITLLPKSSCYRTDCYTPDITIKWTNYWYKYQMSLQHGKRQNLTRRPASTDRTARANFRLLANQWAEHRLVKQWRHGCRAMRRSVCNSGASNAGRSLCVQIPRERSYPLPMIIFISPYNGNKRRRRIT